MNSFFQKIIKNSAIFGTVDFLENPLTQSPLFFLEFETTTYGLFNAPSTMFLLNQQEAGFAFKVEECLVVGVFLRHS